jgi:hypothetical protein
MKKGVVQIDHGDQTAIVMCGSKQEGIWSGACKSNTAKLIGANGWKFAQGSRWKLFGNGFTRKVVKNN